MIYLSTLHGEVHRFTGIIDRMGQRPDKKKQKNLTICVRRLSLAATGELICPDHCWLPLRQELAELNLEPGDEIVFSAKIHRVEKGYQSCGYTPEGKRQSPRRTIFCPSREIKDVSVIKRARRLEQSTRDVEKNFIAKLDVECQRAEQFLKVIETLDLEIRNLNHLKHECPQLEETIAQLEGRVQSSLPRQQALSAVFLSAFFCLITGFGLGASTGHAS